jgi:hypothetical protein
MLASMKGRGSNTHHGDGSIADGWTWAELLFELVSGLLEAGLNLLL